jgi:thiamine-phosphate pyrophosphorylase
MFETKTKEKPRVAGVAYAREVVGELGSALPVVAIGGINAQNIGEVVGAGASCVAVCSAVIGAADPAGAVRALMSACSFVKQHGCDEHA